MMDIKRSRSITISEKKSNSIPIQVYNARKIGEDVNRSKSLSNIHEKRQNYNQKRRVSLISITRKRSNSRVDIRAINNDRMNQAAREGNLKLLMQARNNDEEWDPHTCAYAASGGNLDILKYLRNKDCPWDIETVRAAATGGHLDTLIWAIHKGCKLDNTIFDCAVRSGRINVVKWLREHHPKKCNREVRHNIAAVKSGNLKLLKLLRTWNYPWSDNVITTACTLGKLDIVRWLYENNSPLPTNACSLAAKSGNVELISWLYYKNYDLGDAATHAALAGHLEPIIWIHENAKTLPNNMCKAAATGGNLNILMWLINNGYNCDHNILTAAIEGGTILVIEWIIEHISIVQLSPDDRCNKSTSTTKSKIFTLEHANIAAKHGNCGLLKWLHEHDCPWDIDVPCLASLNGKLDILQYAHKEGCPWDPQTCLLAAESRGHTHISDWITDTLYNSNNDSDNATDESSSDSYIEL